METIYIVIAPRGAFRSGRWRWRRAPEQVFIRAPAFASRACMVPAHRDAGHPGGGGGFSGRWWSEPRDHPDARDQISIRPMRMPPGDGRSSDL